MSVCFHWSTVWAVLRVFILKYCTTYLEQQLTQLFIQNIGLLSLFLETTDVCFLKYIMRVTQQQCEATKADSCLQATPKQYASALISRKLVPLRCAPLTVFVSHGKQLEKARKHAEGCCVCTHGGLKWSSSGNSGEGRKAADGATEPSCLMRSHSWHRVCKRPDVLLLLSLKKGAALRSISRSIFTPDFYSNISTMA